MHVHFGLILAIAAAAGTAWLLDRSTLGFRLRVSDGKLPRPRT